MSPQPGPVDFVRPPPSSLPNSGGGADEDDEASAHPHLLLYCFPHAGGSPSSFRDWEHHLQQRMCSKVSVRVLSLPGRGGRFQETPWDDWGLPDDDAGGNEEGTPPTNDGYRGKFITVLTQAFLMDWDGMTPYAFFGHSFGTLLAYELILQLRRLNVRPLPLVNVVSAHRAPGISPELCGIPQTHTLPRSEFVDMIRAWGLVPEEALNDEDLVDIMIPALRADLRLDETHIPAPPTAVEASQSNSEKSAANYKPMSVPTVLFGGKRDQTVPSDQLMAWREFASASSAEAKEVVWFEGDHFYTVSHLSEVMVDLSQRLTGVLSNVDRSILVGGPCGSSRSSGAAVVLAESGDRCLIEDGFDEGVVHSSADEDSCPTVLDLFFDQVRRTPNFIAMVDESGKEHTYTELRAAVIAFGQHLIRVSSPDEIEYDASVSDSAVTKRQPPRVGIFLHHVSSYLLTNLSSWYAGCSVVLLERNWTGALLREFIEVCEVDVIVTDEDGMLTLMEAGLSRDSIDAPASLADTYKGAEEAEKKDSLLEEAQTPNQNRHSPRILIFPPGGAEELEVSLDPSSISQGQTTMDPDDVAFVSMTSGSTGKPSAVLTTHRGTTFCFESRYELYPYRSTANDLQEREGANVFFAWESIRPLLRGHIVVVIPDEAILSPPHFVNFLHRNKVTRLVVTPSLLESVFAYPHLGETLVTKLAHMYGWFLMGEVVPMRLIERAEKFLPMGVRLVNAYSSWEALDVSYSDLLPLKHCQIKLGEPTDVIATGNIHPVDKTPPHAPVGHPLPKVHALLLDECDRPVPRGVPGTLHVLTPALALGYLDDPVKTSARFRQVPSHVYEALLRVHPDLKPSQLGLGEGQGALLFNTGDLGRIRPDGQLCLLGRGDDTVKIRGYKVGIPFVESTLNGIEGVAAAVVLPIMDDVSQQPDFLAAYIVGYEGKPSETTLLAISQSAKDLLPPYSVPRDFIGIDILPLREGESRKLDKTALPISPSLVKKRELIKRGQGRDRAGPGKKKSESAHSNFSPTASSHKPTKRIEQIISQVWAETLHLEGGTFIDNKDNFFDVGGNSLLASELIGRLSSQYGLPLSVLDLYQHSSLGSLVRYCQNLAREKAPSPITSVSSLRHRRRRFRSPAQYSGKIAIIGMSGRFPGASNLNEFWQNIQAGTDSLRAFTKAELAAQGLPPDVYNNPKWVPAGQVLDDADKFDAAFWDISPREAKTMDPQHRVFLEVAWSALEDAGYPPQSFSDGPRTGVWAACGIDGYLVHHLKGGGLMTPLDPTNLFLTEVGNEKDYISTRVSYALDLGGPSMTVTSACSSGLVAVAQAAQSLMVGQTDVAIAGASSLTFPNMGYCYEKGMVGSVDGHVRPFDEDASGTLFGDGVGAVILKRLEDAIEDGDNIWSLLSGFDVTNDGRQKAGYAAPSASAQAAAIVGAMDMAGVTSEQISYVECHATATHVGDAIELQGLSEAFQATAEHQGSLNRCALGSVKGNIGHANCAAGMSGLIKTILMLKHRQLTPTAHFVRPNTKLSDYLDHQQGSPFYVNKESLPWEVAGKQRPRRAGVSSFGIGGTNAHVVLEEFFSDEGARANSSSSGQNNRPTSHILALSGKTYEAMKRNVVNMANYLHKLRTSDNEDSSPIASLCDIAYTLQCGREGFPWRCSAVVQSHEDAVAALQKVVSSRPDGLTKNAAAPGTTRRRGEPPSVVMCFPGQGSHYSGMAHDLYDDTEGVGRFFRAHFDKICAKFREHLDFDLGNTIFPENRGSGDEDDHIYADSFSSPVVAQPAIFAVELALAQTLLELGVQPVAVAGHSIGEYVAASVAGVLTIDDAVMLIAERAKATARFSGGHGAMLFVKLSPEDTHPRMNSRPDLSLSVAAINGPEQVVISGPQTDIDTFAQSLERDNVLCRRLKVTHAFHSEMMAPVASHLVQCARSVKVGAPRIPLASNVTGRWISAGLDNEMADPDYWGRQMLGTVRWMDNVDAILRWYPTAFVEVGPGNTLVSLLTKHTAMLASSELSQIKACTSLPHARDKTSDDGMVFNRLLSTLWEEGVPINWSLYNRGPNTHVASNRRSTIKMKRPKRVSLPTYSFEKTSHWTNPNASIYVNPEQKSAPTYKVDWQHISTLPNLALGGDQTASGASTLPFIVKFGRNGLAISRDIIEATKSEQGLFVVFQYPAELTEGSSLFSSSSVWQSHETEMGWAFIQFVQDLTSHTVSGRIAILCPASLLGALSIGASRSIVQEYPKLQFQRIFLPSPSLEQVIVDMKHGQATPSARVLSAVPDKCRDELDLFLPDGLVASGRILAQKLEPVPAIDRNVSPNRCSIFAIDDKDDCGIYLITGGTGALGQALVEHLVSHHCVPEERIVLLSRSNTKNIAGSSSSRVRIIQVDCTDAQELERNAEIQSLEKVHGIFHLAGMLDDAILANQTRERLEKVVAPKAAIASLLAIALKKRWHPRFVLAYSSTTSLLGYAGQSNYGAANAILDQMATDWNGFGGQGGADGDKDRVTSTIPIVAVNWGSWGEVGMAAKGTKAYEIAMKQGDLPMSTSSALGALDSLFERLLAQPTASGQYVISGANWSSSPWNKNPIVSHLVVGDEDLRASTDETQSFASPDSEDFESSIISLMSNHISRWEPKEMLVALGLDSLDMLQLVRDISNTFNVDVGLQDVMSSDKTLEDLICLVAKKANKKETCQ